MTSARSAAIGKIALQYFLLCLMAVLCVFPFWWTLVTAVSGSGEVFAYPPQIWPQDPTLAHFKEVFAVIPMADFFRNSMLITVLSVAGKLFFCALAAYPLSRLRFTGRKLVLGIVLATMVLPSEEISTDTPNQSPSMSPLMLSPSCSQLDPELSIR